MIVPVTPTIPEPISIIEPETPPIEGPEPTADARLVASKLTRFPSPERACAELLARSESPGVQDRDEHGTTRHTVKTGCRERHAPGLSFIEFFRTNAFPRHANVESIAAAPAFPIGRGGWLVALESTEESEGMQSMPMGDADGDVEVVNADRVDVVGSEAPELIFALCVADHPHRRTDLVVCDSNGAWCTKPVLLERIIHDELRNERASCTWREHTYSFKRHARGVLVRTLGEPHVSDRLFPLAVDE